MLETYFTTIKQDFNTLFSSDDSDESIKPIDIKVNHAMIRLLSASFMALGLGIVFFALPIVSSGVSVLGLAIGVGTFISGHDMFKLSQNWEAQSKNLANHSAYLSEEEAKRIGDDLEAGTILRPLLRHTRHYWHPWIRWAVLST